MCVLRHLKTDKEMFCGPTQEKLYSVKNHVSAGPQSEQRFSGRHQCLSGTRAPRTKLRGLSQSGDALKAQAEFNEGVRLNPRYAGAHYNLALALHQEGKESAARAKFEKAYEISLKLKNAPRR
jgi:Tfp pilus assembly protein PilF